MFNMRLIGKSTLHIQTFRCVHPCLSIDYVNNRKGKF